MSDLVTRNQSRINTAQNQHIQRLLDLEKSRLNAPSFNAGYNANTGKYQILTLGQGATEATAITNGSIGNGDRVDLQAGQVDSMPYRRQNPQPPQPEELGKVKSLLHLREDDRDCFYVGGDRSKPKKIFTLPEGESWLSSVLNDRITNLGKGNRFLAGVTSASDEDTYYYSIYPNRSWRISRSELLSNIETGGLDVYFNNEFWFATNEEQVF